MIQKQAIPLNFAQGLETKVDPWQVPLGKFLELENSIFTKGGMLQKRNGYGSLASLPNSSSTYLTTLNGNLTAVGSSISALNAGSGSWVSKGTFNPLGLSTLSLLRNSVNQSQCDSAISSNGLVCTVYTETNASVSVYKYAIADSTTGQNIVSPTVIPVSSGTVTGSPRVFLLNNLFVIVFTNVITATPHLQYIAISSSNPSVTTTNQDIASAYVSATTLSWDGVVANGNLYVAYNTTTGGQAIKITYLSFQAAALGQAPATPVTFATQIATMMSMCVDTTQANQTIYLSFYDSAGSTGKMLAIDLALTTKMSVTSVIASGTVLNLASAAQNGICTLYYEVSNNYSYDAAVPSHYIAYRKVTLPSTVTTGTVSPAAGSAASGTVSVRSVGLASKAFILNDVQYFLSVYQSTYQSTYFLINGTSSIASSPMVIAKLAYENAGGYLTVGLPNATIINDLVSVSYLIKDLVAAQSTSSAQPVANRVVGVYTQTGINLATFNFDQGVVSSDIAQNLHLSGGFLWSYDGYFPVEHNFFLYPDSIEVTTATGSGNLTAQDYYYVVCYEWEDNQGNVYRSAPSLPVKQTTTTASSTNTVKVPFLRLTYKTQNPIKVVVYRWSVAQPVFYRVTSLTNVQLNSTSADSMSFGDDQADSAILGNDILYTTGGVVEDINAPAFDSVFLFDDRLWGIVSEDKNLLMFSKQVLESTPVEMSDLLTYYVAPSAGAQGPTGPLKCGAAMDDKLILFKASAMSYIGGSGPDNTGANSGYSPSPIFITSTVGCSNQKSIVFQPQGLMFEFQSEAGNQIWLLGRDLSTKYIGAPVEALTQNTTVQGAVNIPGTNQVRFTLSSGVTLLYDYYYDQWGTFTGVPAISSCVYQGVQAYLNSAGSVLQETPGSYVDGSRAVVMKFKTSWANLAGVQGYQRAYFFYLLGKYLSPHKIYLQIAYDYNESALHSVLIEPTNFSPIYGGSGDDEENPYGQQATYGGQSNVEDWRVFLKKQRCQSFQISFQEIYDSSLGVAPGAGLTLSGLNLVVGLKSGFKTISSRNSAGTG